MLKEYILKNHLIQVHILNYGCRISKIIIPTLQGSSVDIVTGYNMPEEFLKGDPYFGAICGRYANRIALGKFEINGTQYKLATNNGPNHLHGGIEGFNNKYWELTHIEPQVLTLCYTSSDMEEGYPGKLQIEVTYTLNNENELGIEYKAITNKATLCNLTSHGFFNLHGQGLPIANHLLKINSEFYTPVDDTLIPTGEMLSVKSTPFDFIESKKIGPQLLLNDKQISIGNGIDHNFVIKKESKQIGQAATLVCKETGITMEVYTTQPGLQVYTGNYLGCKGKGNYEKQTAICLETQGFPNSPNTPHFPSTLLKPGDVYNEKCIYKFTLNK